MPLLSYKEQGLPCRKGHDDWVLLSNGRWRCRVCNRARSKRWSDANREWVNATHRERKYFIANNLKRSYGLTVQDKERMWLLQHECCAICFEAIPLHGLNTHIDHDHKTGKVRGILCSSCNTAIGHLREDPAIINSALRYLEDHAETRLLVA